LTTPPWRVERITADAGAFHDAPPSTADRSATFVEVVTPTLVLGSSQPEGSVCGDTAAAQGVSMVRRRSGGGGVLLLPGEFVWFDLVIPARDPLWDDDIGRSMWWVGELWRDALGEFEPQATVHRGPLQRSRWSTDVCFAGRGPGEVMVGTAKLVGISQRRTRQYARFQSMVHLHWRPDVVASLVAADPPVDELAPLTATCAASANALITGLTSALTTR
jgi:lipoate---protein ligase